MFKRLLVDSNASKLSRSSLVDLAGRLLSGLVLSSVLITPLQAHDDTSAMVKKILPAVVTLEVELGSNDGTADDRRSDDYFYSPQLEDFMRRFFGDDFFQQQRGLKDKHDPFGLGHDIDFSNQAQGLEARIAYGSGFIISPDGKVVTNYHVVEQAAKITVNLSNEKDKYQATVIGADRETDLAVLQIEADRTFDFVKFGNSEEVQIGEPVVVIGNPLGIGLSVSKGVISAKYRDLGGPYDDYFQTDATINIGNSGGPLFNVDGEVIGVNTAIKTTGMSVGSIGIGFSISSGVVADVVEQIIQQGGVSRGYLGIAIGNPPGEDFEGKIRVETVYRDSAAYRGGLLPGDTILNIDGYTATSVRDFVQYVSDRRPGSQVMLQVERGNEELSLTVELGQRPVDPSVVARQVPMTEDNSMLGMTLEEVQGSEGEVEVRVVTVTDGSAAAKAGIAVDDVIYFVNHNKVTSIDEVSEEVRLAREDGMAELPLIVQRGEVLTEVIVELGN